MGKECRTKGKTVDRASSTDAWDERTVKDNDTMETASTSDPESTIVNRKSLNALATKTPRHKVSKVNVPTMTTFEFAALGGSNFALFA